MYVNEKKCEFGKAQLTYLGHVVSAEDVTVDPSKVQVMINWPRLRTLTELRGFLGLTGYYRKFVQRYGQINGPLIEQLKKDCYGWNEMTEKAFQQWKKTMTQVPVLAMPKFSKPFVIKVDALGFAVGAMLMQEERPIAYHSQVLGQRACHQLVYEKELMVIVLVVIKWRLYLLGRWFLIQTD